jgi:hypothetical protein
VTKTTFKQCDVERAMSEPPHKRARRRLTLSAALKAAKEAGLSTKSAVVEEDGKMTFVFVGDDTSVEAGTNEWDEALKHRGKH